ncbi:tetratricopeptide repeat protein [Rhizobium sp. NFR07]|uniref:tetratricopeptide repeat protein n=1 Tax=Rhizobium sp. NFR07 TaxID=1566262 RepID=UPI000B823DB6|nr:tetratricopeptide repeat protein [Rhizobium sp. NFR07]
MKRIAGGFLSLLLTSAAALGEPPPITWEWYSAAEAYQGSRNRRPDDLRLSAHYFRLAADKGNATAAFKLGELYEAGEGLARDPVQAFYWYMKSAARNNKHGQLKIGWCYQKGIGVQPDPKIAAIWYRLAADNDNIWGYHMLAFMLADGEGMTKDVAQARRYFELSLPKTKDHWAKWKLAHLIAQENPKRAKALLKEAAAAGNVQAVEDLKRAP